MYLSQGGDGGVVVSVSSSLNPHHHRDDKAFSLILLTQNSLHFIIILIMKISTRHMMQADLFATLSFLLSSHYSQINICRATQWVHIYTSTRLLLYLSVYCFVSQHFNSLLFLPAQVNIIPHRLELAVILMN